MPEEATAPPGATRPAPMSELVIGAFGMELRVDHPRTGECLGRPVAAVAMCRRTLMAVGVHFSRSFLAPLDLMYCLADAFTPTDAASFGAKNPWPCEGVADRVCVDERQDLNYKPLRFFRQAVGFKIVQETSPALLVRDLAERWSEERGIEVDTPCDGAATLARWRANMEPLGADRVLLPDLGRKFRRWVVDRYNAQPIPGIERSPLEPWREAAADFVPRFVPPGAPGQYFRPEAMRPTGPRGVV